MLVLLGVFVAAARELIVDQRGGAHHLSIAAAVAELRPGDTLMLAKGSGPYREELYIPSLGKPDAPITVEGNDEVVTGFDPLTGFREENGRLVCDLPVKYPLVLTYRGERLRESAATKNFTTFARLSDDRTRLTLESGVSSNGWEYSVRGFVVRVQNVSHHVYQNLKVSGSRNDGFNLHGTGSNLLFQNIEGFNNFDEGFSSHDNMVSEIRGGSFYGNDNGIGNVASSATTAGDIQIHDNLGYGLWMANCTGTFSDLRSWNNGMDQICVVGTSVVDVTNCTAVTPAWTERRWITYNESKRRPAPVVYRKDSKAVVRGRITLE